jgi:hypothetical protein
MYILKSLITIVAFSPSISMKAFDLSVAECNSCFSSLIESYIHLKALSKSSSCLRALVSDYLSPDACLILTDSD